MVLSNNNKKKGEISNPELIAFYNLTGVCFCAAKTEFLNII
jgi:hypothetical protein